MEEIVINLIRRKQCHAILPLIPLKIAMNIVLKGKGGNAILLQ
jgi:hypothetical protein